MTIIISDQENDYSVYTQFTIENAHDSKKSIPITLLTLKSKLPYTQFKELTDTLKKLNCHYSKLHKGIVFESVPREEALATIEQTLLDFKTQQKDFSLNKISEFKKLYDEFLEKKTLQDIIGVIGNIKTLLNQFLEHNILPKHEMKNLFQISLHLDHDEYISVNDFQGLLIQQYF